MSSQLLLQCAASLAVLKVATMSLTAIKNAYFHPLSEFPGLIPATAGSWWKMTNELLAGKGLSNPFMNILAT
jgi:hypothetical protein